MSDIKILQSLQTNLVTFFDDMINLFPSEPNFLIGRIFIKDQIPIIEVMTYIIINLLPFKKMVDERNEDFFLYHNTLLEKLNPQNVNHFKMLWPKIEEDDKDVIWSYFSAFLTLAEKYKTIKGI